MKTTNSKLLFSPAMHLYRGQLENGDQGQRGTVLLDPGHGHRTYSLKHGGAPANSPKDKLQVLSFYQLKKDFC